MPIIKEADDKFCVFLPSRALSSNSGKRPLAKIGKNDQLNIKLGKIYHIEHNNGSKIYPQNQVILGCSMPSIGV